MKTPQQIAGEAVKESGLTMLYNDDMMHDLIASAIEADRAQRDPSQGEENMTIENRNLTIDERYFGVEEYAEISAAMKVLYGHGVHFKAWLPTDFETSVFNLERVIPEHDREEVIFTAYAGKNSALVECQDFEWYGIEEELTDVHYSMIQQEKI